MHCSNCGNKLATDSRFCNECGKAVAAHAQSARAEKSGNENKKSSVAAIIITSVIVGGILIWIMSSINSSSPQSLVSSDSIASSTSSVAALSPAEKPTIQLSTQQTTSGPKSLADIVSEWRKSAAYVNCIYGSLANNNYRAISGSGLLVELNSELTVITNRHVVNNPAGDLDYCDIKFPGQTGVSYMINPQNISYDSSGNDVAFLKVTKYPDVENEKKLRGDQYFISERAQKRNYLCQGAEKIGDSVIAIGYPSYGSSVYNFTYGYPIEVTATEGIISGKDGVFYTTSAKIDSGNSGGLAIDETNDCYFGIPTWDASGNFESLGRILPASTFLHY